MSGGQIEFGLSLSDDLKRLLEVSAARNELRRLKDTGRLTKEEYGVGYSALSAAWAYCADMAASRCANMLKYQEGDSD